MLLFLDINIYSICSDGVYANTKTCTDVKIGETVTYYMKYMKYFSHTLHLSHTECMYFSQTRIQFFLLFLTCS